MRTVYIDPGVHNCACAFYDAAQLTRVQWRDTANGAILSTLSEHAVVELPVARPGARAKQLADLINLAAAAGRVAGNLPVKYITPESWKGQVPCTCTAKTVPEQCTHHRRMAAALAAGERKIVDEVQGISKGLLHNIYDAVTMGLKLEGRL